MVGLPSFGDVVAGEVAGTHPGRLLGLARLVDDEGLDGVVVPEHVVLGPDLAGYPFGRFPTDRQAPWLDPLTVLAAVAAVTSRVRLQTGIVVAAARPAAVLAKQAATLDVLSGGRLDLGVGTGWQPAELEACGVPFAERGARLTAHLADCRALWTGRPVAALGDVVCAPTPARAGGPAVLVAGGPHAATLDRVTRLADGWIPLPGLGPTELAEQVATVAAAWADAGRPSGSLRVRASVRAAVDDDGRPDPRATVEAARSLLATGATEVAVPLRSFLDPDDPTRDAAAVSALAEAWRGG